MRLVITLQPEDCGWWCVVLLVRATEFEPSIGVAVRIMARFRVCPHQEIYVHMVRVALVLV